MTLTARAARATMSVWVAAALGLLAVAASPSMTRAAGAGVECYGPSIDVDLVNGAGTSRVPLRLPMSLLGAMSISGYDLGGDNIDPFKTCQPEPFLARSVYFVFNHRAVPEIHLVDATLSVRRAGLSYDGENANPSVEAAMEARLRALLQSGGARLMANGFTKLKATPTVAGDYLGPPDTLLGSRLYVECSPAVIDYECTARHAIGRGLWVRYWFQYSKVDPGRWVDLDRAVREAATSLFR